MIIIILIVSIMNRLSHADYSVKVISQ